MIFQSYLKWEAAMQYRELSLVLCDDLERQDGGGGGREAQEGGFYIYIKIVFTWVGKIPWRRKWQPTPIFLPGKSHRQVPVS